MATQKPKSSLPKIVIGSVVLLGVVWYFTGSDSGAKTTNAVATTHKASSSKNSMYDHGDYNANFPPITLAMQDKFVPLVYKAGNSKDPTKVDPTLLTIPSNFTGGEANWAFTGTVSVNGHWSALAENTGAAQNIYLKAGDKWKTSTVENVTENLLTLRDLSGTQKDIPMQADIQAMIAKQQADLADLRVNPNAGIRNSNSPYAPMNPNFFGAIGDPSVAADPNAAAAAAVAAAGTGGTGGGGGRRGGRGGGGGGGRGGRGGGRGGGGYNGGGNGGGGNFSGNTGAATYSTSTTDGNVVVVSRN